MNNLLKIPRKVCFLFSLINEHNYMRKFDECLEYGGTGCNVF